MRRALPGVPGADELACCWHVACPFIARGKPRRNELHHFFYDAWLVNWFPGAEFELVDELIEDPDDPSKFRYQKRVKGFPTVEVNPERHAAGHRKAEAYFKSLFGKGPSSPSFDWLKVQPHHMLAAAEIMANEMGVLPHVRDELLNKMNAHMNGAFFDTVRCKRNP